MGEESARLGRLDGLRGLAACVVAFAYHSQNLFVQGRFADAGPVASWFHTWGWTFVDLFFLISGYIFAHVYLRPGQLTEGKGLGDFVVARIARLYPLHLIVLLVTAALFWAKPENTTAAFIANLLMLQGFLGDFAQNFNGPSWSITVECICYLVFAAGAVAGRRVLGWVTLVAIAWAIGQLVLNGNTGGPWIADAFPRGLLGFFLGQTLWRYRSALSRVPSAVLVALLIAGVVVPVAPWSPLLPLCIVAWPAALLLGLRLQALESKPMLWLGDRSYSIYMVHMLLLDSALKFMGQFDGGLAVAIAVHAGFVAVTLMLADAVLWRIEHPARRAIRQAWQRRSARLAVA